MQVPHGMDGVLAAAVASVDVPRFAVSIANVDAEGVHSDDDFTGLGLGRQRQRGQKTQGRDDGDQDFAEHGRSLSVFFVFILAFALASAYVRGTCSRSLLAPGLERSFPSNDWDNEQERLSRP